MKIMTGKTGAPHVTSQQFRQFVESTVGQKSYILASGENLEPELQTNNLLKIRSGMMSHHGNLSVVDIGTYDEVTIQNGTQGMQRIDLVVNRYTRNEETGIEENAWVVIQGTPAASDPQVPEYTEGNLQEGDLVDDCPVFEVHLNGINVTEVVKLLEVSPDIPTLNASLADSGWIEMTSSISFAEKPMFRKIGKTVYVGGTIRYSDNGIFRNDEIIGDIPSEFIPSSSYGAYECIIPFAFISGNGSRERMYIRGNHVYFAGTSNARDGILAASCYLTD